MKLKYILNELIIFIILVFLAFLINYHANWILGDDIEFLRYTAIGKYLPMSCHVIQNGRFWPLGYYDYNILVLFQKGFTAASHYLYLTLWFIVFNIFILKLSKILLKKDCATLDISLITLWIIVLYLGSSLITVFLDVIYSEKTLVTFFALFMYLFYKFQDTNKYVYLFITIPIIIFSTYCKEPTFICYLIISSTYLIFKNKNISKKELYYLIFLFLNALVFILMYYLIVVNKTYSYYNSNRGADSIFQNLVLIIKGQPLLLLMMFLSVLRFFYVVFKKQRAYLFYDSTLWAGLGFLGVYVVLNMNASYYFVPCIVLSFPSFLFWSFKLFSVNKISFVFLFLIIFFITKPIIGHLPYSVKDVMYHRTSDLIKLEKTMPYISNKSIYFYNEDIPRNRFDYSMKVWEKNVIEITYNFISIGNLSIVDKYKIKDVDSFYIFITSEDYAMMRKEDIDVLSANYNYQDNLNGVLLFVKKSFKSIVKP